MKVSEVCGGTMMWGSFNEKEEMAHEQLDALIRMGVNFLDTAELYPVGWNYGKTTEEWMGNWLAKRTKEGSIDRKKLYIASKINPSGIGTPPMTGDSKVGTHAYEEEILLHACKASIQRLQCGYLDLYQLHWPCRDTSVFGVANFYPEGKNGSRPMPFVAGQGGAESFERQVKGIKRLFDEGLIKHWGLSNENAYGITMFCMACDKLGVPRPVSNQNDFSLLNRTYEGDTWEAAYRFGVVGLPYGVLSGGTLSGKYLPESKYANTDPDRPLTKCRHNSKPDFQPRYAWPAAMLATEKYVALAEEWGLTPTELALAWARDCPCNCNGSIIIGSCSVKQIEECVNAFKLEKLPEELMKEVDAIFEEFRNPTRIYANKEAAEKLGLTSTHKRKANEL
jgi:aryl-alcohol dehydrogenase-like predicted oxidoreductase